MTQLCENWQKAIDLLQSGGYTCVLCREDTVYTTTERGVKPLVRWLTEKAAVQGFYAADKVVGKATAFLYVLLGVKAVHARIMSRSAARVLQENGIEAKWDTLVDNIINRQGTGICPFEEAVLEIQTPEEAYPAIREKMARMNITL